MANMPPHSPIAPPQQPPSLSIRATELKLSEARFFYDHVVREKRRTVTQGAETEAFGHYFSAFIQAARSVFWVLHHEEKDKWEAWEPTWKDTLSEDELELLKITNELRIDEVKRSGASLL